MNFSVASALSIDESRTTLIGNLRSSFFNGCWLEEWGTRYAEDGTRRVEGNRRLILMSTEKKGAYNSRLVGHFVDS